MSQKVSLRQNDYKTIISWFDRLFGKGKDPLDSDKLIYRRKKRYGRRMYG